MNAMLYAVIICFNLEKRIQLPIKFIPCENYFAFEMSYYILATCPILIGKMSKEIECLYICVHVN